MYLTIPVTSSHGGATDGGDGGARRVGLLSNYSIQPIDIPAV